MLNTLDPDQPRRFVGPDLGLNCMQRLSADDTRRQRLNKMTHQNKCDISIVVIQALEM